MDRFPSLTAPGALCFTVTVTLADALDFDRLFRRSKEARRSIGRAFVAGIVAAGVLAFGAMLAARLALAGSGCDLDENFDSNARLRMLLVVAGAIFVLEILAGAAFLWNRQRSLETTYRTRRLKRAGIDPADPNLGETYACAFDRTGFRFHCPSADYASLWAMALRFEETLDHMFVMLSPARGFIVPKRDLPPAIVLALRDLAHAGLPPR